MTTSTDQSYATLRAKWCQMQPRERDAAVAEQVMGIKRRQVRVRATDIFADVWTHGVQTLADGQWTLEELQNYGAPRPYSTDPTADYAVLKHVRETWSVEDQCDFHNKLLLVWSSKYNSRSISFAQVSQHMRYEPGDYSFAAWAVKQQQPT